MKKIAGITVLVSMVLMGCSSSRIEDKTLYLNTEMQSPVSAPTQVPVSADSLLKKDRARNIILYSLRPKPGATFRDNWDRKYTAAIMHINLSPGVASRTAEISGEINYYDVERYENEKLVGDVVKSVSIPESSVLLSPDKPVVIQLPRGFRFSVELTGSPEGQRGKKLF